MEPYVGEIRMFAGNFAPIGWFTCEGQILPVGDYPPLFSLLGFTYGGDGETTFALPDLRGTFATQCSNIRTSHLGGTYTYGQMGGQKQVILNTEQMPKHTHTLRAVPAAADQPYPWNNFLSVLVDGTSGNATNLYNDLSDTSTPFASLNEASIVYAGNNQPIDVTPPFLAMNAIIAWQGEYPMRP